jgi:Holliday junction resolvasome RuvABC endonuclease subunit
MKILALDLATHAGWAFQENDGSRRSGVTLFLGTLKSGNRWIRFSEWMKAWGDLQPNLIVYEKPIHFHKSFSSAEIAFGMATRVEELCARRQIRCLSVTNNVIKKYATGSGRADKTSMLRFAQLLKPGITDDNEADALWLLEYTSKQIVKLKGAA